MIPGETERVWQFLYPAAAVAAATALTRWEDGRPQRRFGLPLLVALSAAQTIGMQTVLRTHW